MYKLHNIQSISGKEQANVIRDNGNNSYTSFPAQENNPDYQQFLKDIKEGVELLDADGNVVTDFVKELP